MTYVRIRTNKKFLKSRKIYKMRLQVYRRYQKPIYKIVITNSNNRIVSTLGYYNPFKIKFRQTYRDFQYSDFSGKIVAVNRTNALFWLRKGIIPSSSFLYFLLYDMGLLKTQSSIKNPKFVFLQKRMIRFFPFLIDTLLSY